MHPTDMIRSESFQYADEKGRTVVATHHEAPPNFSELLGETTYNGAEFGRAVREFKNDPRFDPKYAQAYSELNAVAYLLIAAGYSRMSLRSERPPRPDVHVEFADGSQAFVEAAEVIEFPSARLDGVLNYVNVGIAKAISDDHELKKKLAGHFIGVRAWTTRNGQYDPNEILSEFLRFLRETDFGALPGRQMVSFGDTYPWLSSIDAKYYHASSQAISIPRFDPAAHSFAPQSLAGQVIPVLRSKRDRAASYEGSPLWLALYMSDSLGVPELSLEHLKGIPLDFSPFDKLLLGDQRSVLVYTIADGRP